MSWRSPSRKVDPNAWRWAPMRVAGILLAGLAGIGCLILGVYFALDAHATRKHHSFVSELPDLRSAGGTIGVLEGNISAEVPVQKDGFVAYVREVYYNRSSTRSGSRWHLDSRRTQPLTIETSKGSVRIGNTDYQFDREVLEWSHGEVEESAPQFTQGSVRIRGLLRGRPVMIVGTTKPGGAPEEVVAHTIVGLDRTEYLHQLDTSSKRLNSAVPWLLGIAPFLLYYAGREIWRIARAP